MKAYPAQVHTQTAIVAAIALAKDVGDLNRIAAIDIATTKRGYQMNASEPEKWAPETKETADHSLPYITARAMFDGDINNASYTPEKLHDPRILALMRKIAVKEDPAFAKPAGNAPSARITATLDDRQKGSPARSTTCRASRASRWSVPMSSENSAAMPAAAGRASGPTPSCARCGISI